MSCSCRVSSMNRQHGQGYGFLFALLPRCEQAPSLMAFRTGHFRFLKTTSFTTMETSILPSSSSMMSFTFS